MAENTKIEWAKHTFNPWWGCQKVSEACKNCYAESLDKRWNGDDPHWGPGSPRKMMGEANWKKPIKWNKEAEGKPWNQRTVFCASMADVFEDHPDVVEARKRLWDLIEATPNLVWLLLTKRPENIQKLTASHWDFSDENLDFPKNARHIPLNIMFGFSIETQHRYEERRQHIRFIQHHCLNDYFYSMEPLLTAVNLYAADRVAWIIIGGESGNGPIRKLDLPSVSHTLNLAPFSTAKFVKQLGVLQAKELGLKHSKGGDIDEWPESLQIREFPFT